MTLEVLKDHILGPAHEEFSLADRAYLKMVKIHKGDFYEYERAWRDFLHRIERVWLKTQAAFRGRPNWQKIESEVSQLRKTDPLLNYIQQARHVDEHTISKVAKGWDAQLKAKPTGPNTIELSWQPYQDHALLPVKNRGVIYDPPKSHLGQNIENLMGKGKAEPRVVAELALQFYSDFLQRVSDEVMDRSTGVVPKITYAPDRKL